MITHRATLANVLREACLAAGCFGVFTGRMRGQETDTVVLSTPAARFAEGFTRVGSVRELSDGRVVVLDVYDRSIHLIDSAWSRMTQIGGQGRGPAEYIQPTVLLPLPNDSTAVVDPPNQRMFVITPVGLGGEFLYWATGAAGARLRAPTAADGRGFLYAEASAVVWGDGGRGRLADSAAVERWTAGATVRDTIAYVPAELAAGSSVQSGVIARRAGAPHPFRAQTDWTVARDGRVAIVHYDPYSVTYVYANGRSQTGPVLHYDPMQITEAHKHAWREEQQRPRPLSRISRDSPIPVIVMGNFPYREPAEWPKHLPPFLPGAAHFSDGGMLWIERTGPASDPPTFDVIDAAGRLARAVRLPAQRRLVGFGKRSVYAVRVDAMNLEFLERYTLPDGL